MVGVMDGFRWSLLGGRQLYLAGLLSQPLRRRVFPMAQHPSIPENGTRLRGSDLIQPALHV